MTVLRFLSSLTIAGLLAISCLSSGASTAPPLEGLALQSTPVSQGDWPGGAAGVDAYWLYGSDEPFADLRPAIEERLAVRGYQTFSDEKAPTSNRVFFARRTGSGDCLAFWDFRLHPLYQAGLVPNALKTAAEGHAFAVLVVRSDCDG